MSEFKKELYKYCIEKLERCRKAPRIYATDREAWMSIVITVLSLLEIKGINKLLCKHYPSHGSSYLNLNKPLEDDWARQVIDDAILMIIKSRTII